MAASIETGQPGRKLSLPETIRKYKDTKRQRIKKRSNNETQPTTKLNTIHEWTDGCQAQYKSRHCMGDFSYGCGDFGYRRFIRNYFKTSHAKGPQDAAGGFIKRQLDLAILRGSSVLQSSEDAYKYAVKNLTSTSPSSNCARMIFQHVDADSVDRNRGRLFKPVKDNRSIHQIMSPKSGELPVRNLSRYYENCAIERFDGSIKLAGDFIPRNVTVQTANGESAEIATDTTIPFNISDTIKKGHLVVIYTDDVTEDYYLLKATGKSVRLDKNEEDDWGNVFPKDAEVVRGLYYMQRAPLTFELIKGRIATISIQSVICILEEIKSTTELTVPVDTHERVLGWVEECESYR